MIDIDTIISEFVQIARLPTYSPALSVEPISGLANVYKIRPDDVPKADYPFLTVDLTSITKESGEWVDDLTVDVNENVVYSTNYDLMISFHVYGQGARAIANQLQGFFRFESTRITLEENTGGGLIVQTFDVQSLPQHLADKFVETAVLTLQFVITDAAADTGSTVIDTNIISGELVHQGYDSAADDPNSLEADIEV